MPADAASLIIEDDLEDVLEVVGTPTVDASGAEIVVDKATSKVTATIKDAKVSTQITRYLTRHQLSSILKMTLTGQTLYL